MRPFKLWDLDWVKSGCVALLHSIRGDMPCRLTFRTRGLFSKHFTVVALPLNLICPPKSLYVARGLCGHVPGLQAVSHLGF